MTDDEEQDEPNTFLIDNDPKTLLPYSKRLVPEDPEVVVLPKAHIPSHPALFSENYS
jgi:hypothetical protein